MASDKSDPPAAISSTFSLDDLPSIINAWAATTVADHDGLNPHLALPDPSLLLPFPPAILLTAVARSGASVPTSWLLSVLSHSIDDESWMASSSTRHLAEIAWSVSELMPKEPEDLLVRMAHDWAVAILRHLTSQGRLADFHGPDLSVLVSSCGSLCSYNKPAAQQPRDEGSGSKEAAWKDALSSEVTYQLKEFTSDFVAFDVALMISGLADLEVPCTPGLKAAVMKGVYTKTRTIEEKAAVDFALVKLEEGGEKSILFDPRWTHEELRWLPRIERDKRRILKEGWKKTQWGGYAAGGNT